MEIFLQWMGGIGALCIGIMMLSLFFTVLGIIKRRFSQTSYIKIKGFLNNSDLVNIHLNNGKIVSNVRFIGFADVDSMKGAVPYQLSNMAIVESIEGRRIMLRIDLVRIIETVGVSTEPLHK